MESKRAAALQMLELLANNELVLF